MRVPTFVYWKGMIDPRKSDGLFDHADILPTALSLAGVPGAELDEAVSRDDLHRRRRPGLVSRRR